MRNVIWLDEFPFYHFHVDSWLLPQKNRWCSIVLTVDCCLIPELQLTQAKGNKKVLSTGARDGKHPGEAGLVLRSQGPEKRKGTRALFRHRSTMTVANGYRVRLTLSQWMDAMVIMWSWYQRASPLHASRGQTEWSDTLVVKLVIQKGYRVSGIISAISPGNLYIHHWVQSHSLKEPVLFCKHGLAFIINNDRIKTP